MEEYSSYFLMKPEEAPAPEPVRPEKKKKRRWLGRDPDKPDWEG